MTDNEAPNLTAKLTSHDGTVEASVVAMDHFRVTLRLHGDEFPSWVQFGRTMLWGLEATGERVDEVPVTIARVPMPGSTSKVVVAQVRVLTSKQEASLQRLLGFVPLPPVTPPSLKELRRPKAPPRPLPPHEQREHPRYVVNMDLWVTHNDTTHVMRVRDISRGGMLCEIPLNDSADWVEEGSQLRMRLFPPEEEPMEFKGRIVRVIPKTNRRLASFGVSFDSVAAQVLIGRLLNKLSRSAA